MPKKNYTSENNENNGVRFHIFFPDELILYVKKKYGVKILRLIHNS